MATRNEVIYQSIALYSSPVVGADGTGILPAEASALQRVQDINWGGEVTRTEINCMGKLASLSREIIEEPTVSLAFSYYLANAFNESGCLGMNVQGKEAGGISEPTNLISNILADTADANERNYYVMTVPQGMDANEFDITPTTGGHNGFVGIGNAFMSEYSVNLAVGDIPTANVSFDAANLTFATGASYTTGGGAGVWGIQNPAIDRNGTLPDIQYEGVVSLPKYDDDPGDNTEELSVTALRPGDITLNFGTADLPAGGAILDGMSSSPALQSAHVQSVTITVPMARTPLNTLGNPFAFARKLDVPINTTLAVSANVGDLVTGSLVGLVCDDDGGRTISITLGEKCGGVANMIYEVKGAQLDSQNMSIGIGDSETVELQFTAQIGGANDQANGVFLSGNNVGP